MSSFAPSVGVAPQLLTAIVAASLLVGCVAPPAAPPQAASRVIAFGTPVVVDAERMGGEPTMAIGPDGTILICSPHGTANGTKLWRSQDGGASFHFVGLDLAGRSPSGRIIRAGPGDLGGNDCHLSATPEGRWYLADLWVGSASVSRSTDGGTTWSGTPFSHLTPPVDRPWVLASGANEVFVASQQPTLAAEGFGAEAPPVGGIWVARSTDGGATFPTQSLVTDNGARLGFQSNLAEGPGGLYIAYPMKVGEGRLAIVVARSEDRGASWSERVAAEQAFFPGQCFSPLSIFPTMAADATGGVYVAWSLQNPLTNRTDLFVAASADGGDRWNAPIMIADREGTRLFPWIAARGPGQLGLAWYETNVSLVTWRSDDVEGDLRLSCVAPGPEDSPWSIRFASMDDARDPAPRWDEVLVQPEPVTRDRYLHRPYAELLGLAFDPQGRAAVAYVADVPEGIARPMFALQEPGPPGGPAGAPGATGDLGPWLVPSAKTGPAASGGPHPPPNFRTR